MKYLVAVSGGVDSVVLLDMLSRSNHKLIVAHVDHGIRDDSAEDARFVAALAKHYQLPFVSTRVELGKGASEDRARAVRYRFLFEQAEKFGATIATAHHRDDMVETIALNLTRGTGWRGLAVLNRQGINRPLLAFSKSQLYTYALKHRLEWVEDSTNKTDMYLRNRLRARLVHAEVDTECLAKLRARQLQLTQAIDREADRLLTAHVGSRHFLTQLDHEIAVELLGYAIKQKVGVRPLRSQLERAVIAAKIAKPGSAHHVGNRTELKFSARKYQISVL
ncbi:MAG: tRNA lysidine(34) synthetase TilS [Candidatus Saccharimonas sp.]|nr:tRNA lysidine(34) synthetase TilS [Candidatus Saccharimonas sp.]